MDEETKKGLQFVGGINAGFTSPARDYMGEYIDLNEMLIKHPASTFVGYADGDCLNDVGIFDGDMVLCDKSLELMEGDIAVCYVDGEFTMKRVKIDQYEKVIWLMPANKEYQPIKITPDNNFLVWGIIIRSIRTFRR